MKNFIIRAAVLCLMASFVTGCCTSNRNIPLQEAFWQNKGQKITVAQAAAPTPEVHQFGGQGLLDMAITSIANKELNNSVKKTDLAWYKEIPQNFAKRLKEKQIQATVYQGILDLNQKNQASSVLTETNADLLLVFQLKAVGARRQYTAGFIPDGGPEGYCVLVGELIDPRSKKVMWHHETEVIQKVQGKWDQPPHFSNFNAALNVAIADAKQELLDSFFSGR